MLTEVLRVTDPEVRDQGEAGSAQGEAARSSKEGAAQTPTENKEVPA